MLIVEPGATTWISSDSGAWQFSVVSSSRLSAVSPGASVRCDAAPDLGLDGPAICLPRSNSVTVG